MSQYVEVNNPETQEAALKLAEGNYQRDLLLGVKSLSGSSLRGEAKRWKSKYATSRNSLLRRIKEAGLPIHEVVRDHGRRVLVFD